GPALAEREVVLLAAALVGVAFDADLQLRVLGQDAGHVGQLLLRVLGQRGGVELEEDADALQRLERLVEVGLSLGAELVGRRHGLAGLFGLGLGLRLGLLRARVGRGRRGLAGDDAGSEGDGEEISSAIGELHFAVPPREWIPGENKRRWLHMPFRRRTLLISPARVRRWIVLGQTILDGSSRTSARQ